jgi:hypothetical protein
VLAGWLADVSLRLRYRYRYRYGTVLASSQGKLSRKEGAFRFRGREFSMGLAGLCGYIEKPRCVSEMKVLR